MTYFIRELYREVQELDTSPEQLFRFGVIVGAILVMVTSFLVWQGGDSFVYRVSALVGATLFLASFARPSVLRYPYFIWMGIALILGFFVSRFLFFLLYYFFLTPIGILMQWVKGDALHKTIEKGVESYWLRREKRFQKEDMEKMF